MEIERDKLTREMQTSLLLMNQPIMQIIREMLSCDIQTPIAEAIIMNKNKQDILCITQNNKVLGVVTDKDIRSRVSSFSDISNTNIGEIISAPIISISESALLYECLLKFRNYDISHLLVKNNLNKTENICHVISSVSDSISEKVIELGIEKFGKPPCKFAFIAMGSEGRQEQTLKTGTDFINGSG